MLVCQRCSQGDLPNSWRRLLLLLPPGVSSSVCLAFFTNLVHPHLPTYHDHPTLPLASGRMGGISKRVAGLMPHTVGLGKGWETLGRGFLQNPVPFLQGWSLILMAKLHLASQPSSYITSISTQGKKTFSVGFLPVMLLMLSTKRGAVPPGNAPLLLYHLKSCLKKAPVTASPPLKCAHWHNCTSARKLDWSWSSFALYSNLFIICNLCIIILFHYKSSQIPFGWVPAGMGLIKSNSWKCFESKILFTYVTNTFHCCLRQQFRLPWAGSDT